MHPDVGKMTKTPCFAWYILALLMQVYASWYGEYDKDTRIKEYKQKEAKKLRYKIFFPQISFHVFLRQLKLQSLKASPNPRKTTKS